MSKIDLYDPKWIDLVFQDKNKEYGAYQLRKGTSSRNIKALAILIAAALIIGGYLVWKIQADKAAAERQAYMEQLELSRLQEQAKNEKKDEPKVEKPKIEQPKKEIPQVRETQKFTAPVIKKDELVKEENEVKAQSELKSDVAVGVKDEEGVKDRNIEAARTDVVAKVEEPPKPEPAHEVKKEVESKIFDVVEQPPSFPGGQSALLSWLSNNIHYPPVAEENGIQGRVVVSFVVEPDGTVSNVQVVRGVDPSLDKEAVRVTKSMPKWVPGKQNGQAVRVKYNLPVTFKLQ